MLSLFNNLSVFLLGLVFQQAVAGPVVRDLGRRQLTVIGGNGAIVTVTSIYTVFGGGAQITGSGVIQEKTTTITVWVDSQGNIVSGATAPTSAAVAAPSVAAQIATTAAAAASAAAPLQSSSILPAAASPVASSPTASSPAAPAATSSSSSSGSSSSGQTYTGQATWYEVDDGAQVACGGSYAESDYIAAVSWGMFDQFGASANPNSSPMCGKSLTATYQGKSVTVKVVDKCQGCATDDIDLTSSAFSQLADTSLGRLSGVTWSFD